MALLTFPVHASDSHLMLIHHFSLLNVFYLEQKKMGKDLHLVLLFPNFFSFTRIRVSNSYLKLSMFSHYLLYVIASLCGQISSGAEDRTGLHCSGFQPPQNHRVPCGPGWLYHQVLWQRWDGHVFTLLCFLNRSSIGVLSSQDFFMWVHCQWSLLLCLYLSFRHKAAGQLDAGSRGSSFVNLCPELRSLRHQHILGHCTALGPGHLSEEEKTQY